MSVQDNRYPLPLTAAELVSVVPCSRGAGCPIGVDAPAIATAVAAGDHPRAYLIARASNPFASACGHGCHAPCESACRRCQSGAPVAIASLEAYAAGFSVPSLLASPEPCTSLHDARSVAALVGQDVDSAVRAPRSGKRIAIVGGGAAGMSCAHDLILLGHSCVVFDAASEPGGLLTNAIPEFRFPVASARAECAAIIALGVEYRNGTRIEGFDGLGILGANGFDAFFVAVGASEQRKVEIQGMPVGSQAIADGMDVLAGKRSMNGSVVVLGDGDLACDAARTLARTGTNTGIPSQVTLVLTSPAEQSAIPPPILAATLRDGVVLYDGWQVRRVLAAENGNVTNMEIARPDALGSRLLKCESVVLAFSPISRAADIFSSMACDDRGLVAVDRETLATSVDGVWAGGACAFGHRSIAHAVADGKKAAWHIHAYLSGTEIKSNTIAAWVELESALGQPAQAPDAERKSGLLIDDTPPVDVFSNGCLAMFENVLNEAQRCYDCRVLPIVDERCTTCGKCAKVCPTAAFFLSTEGESRLHFDQNLCTRCGICVQECPEGAIAMLRAVWEERLILS